MKIRTLLPLAALAFAAACADNATIPNTPAAAPVHPRLTAAPSGAGYTSVDETVDGTGHCKNGNPNNNCNIYDGKQYVWLNGGPLSGDVGDGTYFFAVLEPSGQADPNDGDAHNLSDDFDAYTNRTFTIANGVVTYGGTHDKDGNKIRLMPYGDTGNPGGVYILAICSLADNYPVKASKCKYDAFKIQEGEITPGQDLTVTKDANGAYDNTYVWTITKDADKTTVKQIGGSATFTYTINVQHDGGTISGITVNGTISVFNPNVDNSSNTVSVTGVDVTDQLSDGTVCTVTNGTGQTLTQAKTTFAYTCSLSGLPQGELDNMVTVTWPDQFLDNGASLAAGSAHFTFNSISFAQNAIDECVNVTDSVGGTLGTACVGGANPTRFSYQRTIPVPANDCQSYDNTATFTTNDTGATGSASKTVNVCGPAKTGALTIGFWKGPNGNSLIQNFCLPAGKTSLASYLAGLGAGTGPFADAAGKSCSQLVTYVNSILNGASATDMNKMLKAQMLGTALDVYFSTSTLGYSTTAAGSGKNQVKPPSSFLPNGGIGTFNMDLTAICPMVDNLSTGTATCSGTKPSTDGVAAGALPSSPMTVQAILNFAATVPSPFNGSTASSIWYGGNRTKEEILKNVFDQINNQLAFGVI